jgi:ribosomal protein S15P/S13E
LLFIARFCCYKNVRVITKTILLLQKHVSNYKNDFVVHCSILLLQKRVSCCYFVYCKSKINLEVKIC